MKPRNLIVIFSYLVLALITTYPLAMNFATHVPGSETWAFDEYTFLWNFWWLKHAVFDLGVNPLQTNYTFYPIGAGLVLYTFTLLNATLAIPLEFAFNIPAASNTLVLFSFAVGGFGAYLLAKYLLQVSKFQGFRVTEFEGEKTLKRWNSVTLELAAFVAGVVYAFNSSRFVYAALGHTNFVSSQYLPFFALFFIKTLREPRFKNAALAGVFAAFAILTETTFAVFLALFALLYLLLEAKTMWARAFLPAFSADSKVRATISARGWIARLVLMAVVAFAFAAPLIVPSVIELASASYTLPGWGHAEKLVVDLVGLFTPTSLHPLSRNWVQELDQVRQGTSAFVDVNTVFVGYATLALAAIGAWVYRRQLKVWIVAAISFAVLALGPLLHIGGKSVFDFDGLQASIPLPFLLLHYLPFFRENRVPNRFGILMFLALAVLAAGAMNWTSQKAKLKSQKLASVLPFAFLLLTLFEHLSIPLPLTDARVPDVYRVIAQENGDFAILSLPLGWRNSFSTLGAEDTRTQYYQSVHGKRLLAGNTSRNAPFLFEYFDRISFLHSLTELEMYREVSEETLARDQREASAFVAFFDIRYLVINAAVAGRVPYSDTRGAAMEYALKVLPLGEKVYDRDGVMAYHVNQMPIPTRQQIAFGGDDAAWYQAESWDRGEVIANERANWANRQRARVLFPVREIADYAVAVRALPYTYAGAPTQTMEIAVNGQAIQKFEMKDAWENYSATVPAAALRAGLNEITLRFAYAVRPRDVLSPQFGIGRTGIASPVSIVAEGGASASVKVNDVEVSRMKKGYNVVVLDPKTGAVISSQAFNTADSRDDSRALTAFIERIPSGAIVAIASQEGAAVNLGDRAVGALQSLGANVDPRAQMSYAHALIGVQGAAKGTAIESLDRAAFAWVGRNPDERTLAAGVSQITIEKR